MSLFAIKYRTFSFAVKFLSSVAFPIAIAKTYGATVNGEVQLLIAATGYLGLLDSGMSISAINRAGIQSGEPQSNASNILRTQTKSSIKILLIGSFISGALLYASGRNHWFTISLLLGGSLLALATICEIAVTPFKYHLYSYGLAGSVEKREAFLSAVTTLTILAWSMLIMVAKIPLLFGLPIGLILLRVDRVASGLASFRDLQTMGKLSADKNCLKNGNKSLRSTQGNLDNYRHNRVWISALQVLAVLNWSADIFLINFIEGASAVSDYSIYSKFFMLPMAIATLANPVIQSAVSQGRLTASRFALISKFSWPFIVLSTTLIALISVSIISAFPFVSSRIGLTSNPSIYLIIIFSCLSMLSIISGFYAPIANGLQIFKYQVAISAIFLPSNVLLSWFLGSRCGFGMAGILAATCVTMTITSCIIMPKEMLRRLRNTSIKVNMIGNI